MTFSFQMLFDRMDDWRHHPNYQLERRADIFFALYLAEALENRYECPIRQELVPEFPIRIGTIYPAIRSDKSYKVDYVAVSKQMDKVFLVELKTEGLSRRPEQDDYLLAAKKVGMARLLEGLLDIFRATDSKRKYFRLLEYLETMGLLDIPTSLKQIMSRPLLQGATEASRGIQVILPACETEIVYVQPSGTGQDTISFQDFSKVVRNHEDPVSQRFSQSLLEWANIQAGEARKIVTSGNI